LLKSEENCETFMELTKENGIINKRSSHSVDETLERSKARAYLDNDLFDGVFRSLQLLKHDFALS